jgi:hypothetical protein
MPAQIPRVVQVRIYQPHRQGEKTDSILEKLNQEFANPPDRATVYRVIKRTEGNASDEDVPFAWSRLPADAQWAQSPVMLRAWTWARLTGHVFSFRDSKWIVRVLQAAPSLQELVDGYRLCAGYGLGVEYSMLELSRNLFGTPFNTISQDIRLAMAPWENLDSLLIYQEGIRQGSVPPPVTDDKDFQRLYDAVPELAKAVRGQKSALSSFPIPATATEQAARLREGFTGTLFSQEWLLRSLVAVLEPTALDRLIQSKGKDLSQVALEERGGIETLVRAQSGVFWQGFQLANIPPAWWPMFKYLRPKLEDLITGLKAHHEATKGGSHERTPGQAVK